MDKHTTASQMLFMAYQNGAVTVVDAWTYYLKNHYRINRDIADMWQELRGAGVLGMNIQEAVEEITGERIPDYIKPFTNADPDGIPF